MRRSIVALLAGSSAGVAAIPAAAQDRPVVADDATSSPTIVATQGSTSAATGKVYEPDYFNRFAPRNALDMVQEVPGFSISGSDNSRGLGQARQNVLINGQRLTSKTSSTQDQLGRIPADKIVRIEIVEGTSLDIPGLSGQVANIITKNSGLSGQFKWEGGFRTRGSDPEWYGGEISASGNLGAIDFTLAISNNNNRFGSRGPTVLMDNTGTVIEQRFGGDAGAFDAPKASAALSYDPGGDVLANFNASFARTFYNKTGEELRQKTGQAGLTRTIIDTGGTPEYEIGGDIIFPFGPGKLKLIALEAYDAEVAGSIVIDTPVAGIATGSKFTRDGGAGEHIGRFEYSWAMLGGDWQLSGEAAFNRLDLTSRLFSLEPDGSFTEVAYDAGTGGVREARYESILSFNRQLTPNLALQMTAGGEISKIELTGDAASSRHFKRPKGSLSLAWQPESGLDLTLRMDRRVGQLSFEDFLGQLFLDNGNANGANGDLVPVQIWGLTIEMNKSLGVWGSTNFTAAQRWADDFVDFVPLVGGGEAKGNIDRARRIRLESNSTFKLDPLGFAGAQLDVEAMWTKTRLRDPLDGLPRSFSGDKDRTLEVSFRHDIPKSSWAYGGGYTYEHRTPYFRASEIGSVYEGPSFANAFVEHKNLMGLTVNVMVSNIIDGRDRLVRTVYDGNRTDGIIRFSENRNRKIGPIFRFNVSGNF
ncbi:MAG: TonB-dependent receptor plug domain-containing protein [Pontixanthobacter sp.]